MKARKILKLTFKFTVLFLLCAGLVMALAEAQWIWSLTIAAGLLYEIKSLFRKFLIKK